MEGLNGIFNNCRVLKWLIQLFIKKNQKNSLPIYLIKYQSVYSSLQSFEMDDTSMILSTNLSVYLIMYQSVYSILQSFEMDDTSIDTQYQSVCIFNKVFTIAEF